MRTTAVTVDAVIATEAVGLEVGDGDVDGLTDAALIGGCGDLGR